VLDAFGHVSVRTLRTQNLLTGALHFAIRSQRTISWRSTSTGTSSQKPRHDPTERRIIHGAILKARPEMNAVFHAIHWPSSHFGDGHPSCVPSCTWGVSFHQGVPVYDDYEPGYGMLSRQGGRGAHCQASGRAQVQLLLAMAVTSLPRTCRNCCLLHLPQGQCNRSVADPSSRARAQRTSPLSGEVTMPVGSLSLPRPHVDYWVARVRRICRYETLEIVCSPGRSRWTAPWCFYSLSEGLLFAVIPGLLGCAACPGGRPVPSSRFRAVVTGR